MRHDHKKVHDFILDSGWDRISIVAPGELPWEYSQLKRIGIVPKYYDIDPKFIKLELEGYVRGDPIFDPLDLSDTLIVNMNAHKMYPIGKVYKGEFIIAGTSFGHNGDCNVINSCEQLIDQNELHTVYGKESFYTERKNYHIVWGRND